MNFVNSCVNVFFILINRMKISLKAMFFEVDFKII